MPNNFHGYTLSRPTQWIQSVSVKSRAPHVVQPPAHRRACTAAHGTVSRARPVCLWLLSPNSAPQPCISFLPLIPTGGISPFPTQLHHIPRRAYPYRSHAPERVRYPCVVTRSACCCASRCSPPRLETALLRLHSKGMASTSSAYVACARWWICKGRERSAQKMCLRWLWKWVCIYHGMFPCVQYGRITINISRLLVICWSITHPPSF